MERTRIPVNRLPRTAAADPLNALAYIIELFGYFRGELYRVFFFIIDLLTLVARV